MTIWPQEHSEYLREICTPLLPTRAIATALNERFGTTYSRMAVIGRAHRMGLVLAEKCRHSGPVRKEPRKYKPRAVKVPVIRVLNGSIASAPKISAEPVILRCVEIEPRHLSLADLRPGDCRYPYGDGPFTFCGHPQKLGTSYCRRHVELCDGTSRKPAFVAPKESTRFAAGWV